MKSLKDSFAQYLRTIGYGSSTQNMMRCALAEFLENHPEDLSSISKAEIINHANYLSNRPNKKRGGGLSSSMLRQYLYGLKVFFSWCEQTGKISKNPMSGFVLPAVENMERVILTRSEIHELYEVCTNYRDRSILGLFYGCGLRRSEGEKLNGVDIDFIKSLLYVRKGKGGKRRVIPLSVQVRNDLLNYHQEERGQHPEQVAFMLNESGTRMKGNTYNKRLKILLSKSGILKSITLHSLRHDSNTPII